MQLTCLDTWPLSLWALERQPLDSIVEVGRTFHHLPGLRVKAGSTFQNLDEVSCLFWVTNLCHPSGAPFTCLSFHRESSGYHTRHLPKAGRGQRCWLLKSSKCIFLTVDSWPVLVLHCPSKCPWSKRKARGFKMACSTLKNCGWF